MTTEGQGQGQAQPRGAAAGDGVSPYDSLWMRRAGGPRILIFLAVTNLFAYATRNALFGVYPDLRVRFGVDDKTLGLLTTVFLVPHAIATLPFGWAGDRYDRRRVIAIGMVIASIAGAVGAAASSIYTLGISRAVVGLGTAAVVPVANSILGQLYEGPRKASRMAIFNLGLLFGGLVGFGAGIALGFPFVVIVLAVPGLFLGLGITMLPVPAHPAQHERVPLLRYLVQLGKLFVVEGRQLLRIRTLRWLIASTTAMAFAAGGFNAWLLDFLEREKHLTKGEATSILSIALVGAVIGIVVGGRLADRLRERHIAGRMWTIVLGMVGAIPCTAMCIELPMSAFYVVAATANFFFFSWYHAPMAVTVDDLAPPESAVAAQGLVIFVMHLFGTASASYVVGIVSDHSSLRAAMWVPAAALVLAAVAMLAAIPSFAADHARARARV